MEFIHLSLKRNQTLTDLFEQGKIDEIIERADYSVFYDLIQLRDVAIQRGDLTTADKLLIKAMEIVEHLVSLTPEDW